MDDIRPVISASPPRLLDQILRHMRDAGYAWKTEKAYIHWIRLYKKIMRVVSPLDGP